jgi:cobalt-zinc-cadmium efflux system membrane fusion protein
MISMSARSTLVLRPTARVVAAAAGLLLMACGGDGTGDAAPAASAANAEVLDTATLSAEAVKIAGFTLDTARTLPWQATVTVPGRLELDPNALETIGSIVEGRITHVTVRVGDRVGADQPLVMVHSHEIMDARSTLRASTAHVTAMQAERDLAATAAGRAQRLFDNKAMSRAELERAQVAQRVAESNYERAEAERARANRGRRDRT